jgi:hypothetical protein
VLPLRQKNATPEGLQQFKLLWIYLSSALCSHDYHTLLHTGSLSHQHLCRLRRTSVQATASCAGAVLCTQSRAGGHRLAANRISTGCGLGPQRLRASQFLSNCNSFLLVFLRRSAPQPCTAAVTARTGLGSDDSLHHLLRGTGPQPLQVQGVAVMPWRLAVDMRQLGPLRAVPRRTHRAHTQHSGFVAVPPLHVPAGARYPSTTSAVLHRCC